MDKQLSKEAILGLSFYPHECGGMIECITKQDALKAMDEWAKQEAIAFAEWVDNNYWFQHDDTKLWWNSANLELPENITSEQLYQLFQQPK